MIIHRDGALGDMLMMTPAIRELRMRKPGIFIGVRTFFPDVFKNNPYVDEADRYLTRAAESVLSLNAEYEKNMDRHPVNAYAEAIIGTSGFDGKHLELFPDEADRRAVDEWWIETVKTEKPVAVVHLGITWVHFDNGVLEDVMAALSKRFQVILVGRHHPGKEYYPQRKTGFIDLVGQEWTVHQLHWLIQKAEVFFGTDTGVMHIASTTNTPIVCCYSFVDPQYRMPFRPGVPFEAVTLGGECDTPFCSETRKIVVGNGNFGGVNCENKYQCSRGITCDMIMEKIEKVTS